MAVIDHHHPVSDEFVRDRARGWDAFTHFMKYAVIGVVVVLVLMAIFLL